MMFRASGLSTKIQWRTSRIPERSDKTISHSSEDVSGAIFVSNNVFFSNVPIIPDEDSSLSSLLTNQSNLRENWVQLVLFPRIREAEGNTKVYSVLLKYSQGLVKFSTILERSIHWR